MGNTKKLGYGSGKVTLGVNDLKTLYPEVAEELIESKTGFKATQVRAHSNLKAWFKCKACGFEWESTINNRTNDKRPRGCPECSRRRGTSYPEQVVYWAIKEQYPDAINRYIIDKTEIDIFIPELNLGIEYDGCIWHSDKKAEQREVRKNDKIVALGIKLLRIKEISERYSDTIEDNRIDIIKYIGDWEPVNLQECLSGITEYIKSNFNIDRELTLSEDIIKKANEATHARLDIKESIVELKPDIILDWYTEKNSLIGLYPETLTPGSHKEAYWKCHTCGYEWKATINYRVQLGCSCCENRTVVKGINTIEDTHPFLLQDWDYEKNKVKPDEITVQRHQKVHWKCHSCRYEWESLPNKRISGNMNRCPNCRTSFIPIDTNKLYSLDEIPDVQREMEYVLIRDDMVFVHNFKELAMDTIYRIHETNAKYFEDNIVDNELTGYRITRDESKVNKYTPYIEYANVWAFVSGIADAKRVFTNLIDLAKIEHAEIRFKFE